MHEAQSVVSSPAEQKPQRSFVELLELTNAFDADHPPTPKQRAAIQGLARNITVISEEGDEGEYCGPDGEYIPPRLAHNVFAKADESNCDDEATVPENIELTPDEVRRATRIVGARSVSDLSAEDKLDFIGRYSDTSLTPEKAFERYQEAAARQLGADGSSHVVEHSAPITPDVQHPAEKGAAPTSTSETAKLERRGHRRVTTAASPPAGGTGAGMIEASPSQPIVVPEGAVTSGQSSNRKGRRAFRAETTPVTSSQRNVRKQRPATPPETVLQRSNTMQYAPDGSVNTSTVTTEVTLLQPVAGEYVGRHRTTEVEGEQVSVETQAQGRHRAHTAGENTATKVAQGAPVEEIALGVSHRRDGLATRDEPGLAPKSAEHHSSLTDPLALSIRDLQGILPAKAWKNLNDGEKEKFLQLVQGVLSVHYQRPETIEGLAKVGLNEKEQWASLTQNNRLTLINILVEQQRAAQEAALNSQLRSKHVRDMTPDEREHLFANWQATTEREAAARQATAKQTFWSRAKRKFHEFKEKHLPREKVVATVLLGTLALGATAGSYEITAHENKTTTTISAPAAAHGSSKTADHIRADVDFGRQANQRAVPHRRQTPQMPKAHSEYQQTRHAEWAPRPGEMPWNVLLRNGVPAGQIMHDLDQAAKQSGAPYDWHGNGTHKWLEVNGKSDTKSIMKFIGKQIINQR